MIDTLRNSITAVYNSTDKSPVPTSYKDLALMCLDAYEQHEKMAALSECRALLVKLSAYSVGFESDELEQLLKR